VFSESSFLSAQNFRSSFRRKNKFFLISDYVLCLMVLEDTELKNVGFAEFILLLILTQFLCIFLIVSIYSYCPVF
jgi:hypothetical protein